MIPRVMLGREGIVEARKVRDESSLRSSQKQEWKSEEERKGEEGGEGERHAWWFRREWRVMDWSEA